MNDTRQLPLVECEPDPATPQSKAKPAVRDTVVLNRCIREIERLPDWQRIGVARFLADRFVGGKQPAW